MTKLICYRRCSSCKAVRKLMDELGMEYTTREIDLENPSKEELKKWHQASGLPLSRFFNSSGMKYRELGLAAKRKKMTEEEQYEVLATDGMLVKRPILSHDGAVYVGPDVKKHLQALAAEKE